jgi:hypothetical protein
MSCFSPRLVTRACRKPSCATRSAAISGASIAGGLNSQPWARRRAAAQAGCCSLGRRAIAKLVNRWATDHTTTLAGATPILALDMYEHSYHMDYGARAAAYVDAFMAAINWPDVARAYGELRP